MSRSPASLTRYREKRDFTRTSEPAGKVQKTQQQLSYVVQRHAARRLHYDLRLEWRGVMKSWAVTRGPSLDPADKRLAVEVEDHPIDYNAFEGTIPKPDYGGGTVQIWDRGVWAPLNPATVDQDLAAGELKFVLVGERLTGGFVLVRMKPRRGQADKHHNWLLIKERDSAATPGAGDVVLRAETSVVSGRTLDEIAREEGQGAAEQQPVKKASGAKNTGGARSQEKSPAGNKASAKPAAVTKTRPASAKVKAAAETTRRVPAKTKPSAVATRRASAKTKPAAVTTRSASVKTKAAAVTTRSASVKTKAAAVTTRLAPAKTRPAVVTSQPAPAKASRDAAIPRFIAPQLCKLVDTPPTGDAWVHELKLDGYRLQLRVEAGKPVLRTRTGLDWTDRFPSIAKAAAALPDGLMDGEAVALDAKGHPSFAALQATLAGEQRAPIVYFIFDLLHDGHRDLRNEPLEARKRLLRPMIPDGETSLRYLDHFAGPGETVLGSACELGMEGIVSKRRDGHYFSGRGDGWTKAKCRGRDEFLIGGWSMDKKARGLGALLVGAHRDGKLVYLGRVGTGFSAALGDDLLRRLEPLRAATSPFAGRQPARTSDVIWAAPDLVAEVAYGGWTEAEGLLRHASFLGLRDDKPAAEVTPPDTPSEARADRASAAAKPPGEPPGEPMSKAPGKPPGKAASRPAGTLTISHPERVLWPATSATPAVTKADLAAYYTRFADRLLDHIGGRPLSIVRAPDGVTGQLFMQRHAMRGQSPLIGSVTIAGQSQPFLRVDDAPGLAALAQISVVELHPWGARADTPDIPDRLVFDFDPAEGLGFEAVIQAALDLRERLKQVGLTGFARVTGGKGMHVVVPLAAARRGAAPGWPEAKQFARLICAKMAQDAPDRYTTTMAKQARGGKIFLDYLRNDRFATAVASWSPRGRPGAPIACPVSWAAVKPGLDPAGWRLPALLDAALPRDPWAADFAAAAGDLHAAIVQATQA